MGQHRKGCRMSKEDWVNVSRLKILCPCCKKKDWCSVSRDGRSVLCRRTPIPGKELPGGGSIHRLHGQANRLPPRQAPPRRAPLPHGASKPDLGTLMATWQKNTPETRLCAHAASLGVEPWTLRQLGAAWAPEYNAVAFPMTDANRRIIGIRLRAENGFKWAVTGSHNALFIPAGVPSDQCDTILICEGPTTCAALLGLNYQTIGRASCSSCVDLCVQFIREDRRHVVIAADEDEAKLRPDGTYWFPGAEGAAALAKALVPVALSVKVIFPLVGKDARDWIRAGATRAVVDCQIRNSLEVQP